MMRDLVSGRGCGQDVGGNPLMKGLNVGASAWSRADELRMASTAMPHHLRGLASQQEMHHGTFSHEMAAAEAEQASCMFQIERESTAQIGQGHGGLSGEWAHGMENAAMAGAWTGNALLNEFNYQQLDTHYQQVQHQFHQIEQQRLLANAHLRPPHATAQAPGGTHQWPLCMRPPTPRELFATRSSSSADRAHGHAQMLATRDFAPAKVALHRMHRMATRQQVSSAASAASRGGRPQHDMATIEKVAQDFDELHLHSSPTSTSQTSQVTSDKYTRLNKPDGQPSERARMSGAMPGEGAGEDASGRGRAAAPTLHLRSVVDVANARLAHFDAVFGISGDTAALEHGTLLNRSDRQQISTRPPQTQVQSIQAFAIPCAICGLTIETATTESAKCSYGRNRGGRRNAHCCSCAFLHNGWSGMHSTGCWQCRHRISEISGRGEIGERAGGTRGSSSDNISLKNSEEPSEALFYPLDNDFAGGSGRGGSSSSKDVVHAFVAQEVAEDT